MSSSFASESAVLAWEGAADRKPQRYLLLRVDRVSKESGGLFGLRKSPSFADSYPDPMVIEATGEGGRWRLRGPGAELPQGLAQGERVAVGLVDAGHFICVLKPPRDLADDAVAGWAAGQTCG